MFYSENLNKNKNIKHCFFSRKNGASKGIYASLNCGIGSKDDKLNVKKNLEIVSKEFNIDSKCLVLMNQKHSSKVEIVENKNNFIKVDSDAILTKSESLALCVLTADCAPILVYEEKERIIGCIHAGWKGAISGIIENTIKKLKDMDGKIEKLSVCVGPCIAQKNYEVKEDFKKKFIKKDRNNLKFFKINKKKLYFDLTKYIYSSLKTNAVKHVDFLKIDTYDAKNKFFSARRALKLNHRDYGRNISIIMLN